MTNHQWTGVRNASSSAIIFNKFKQSSPLTDLSQSTLLASSRSGSVMALPGRIFLKKAKSSWVILEKGSLSGAAAGDGLDPSVPACSFRLQTPECHRVLGRNGLWGPTGENIALAVDEQVPWGPKCLRAALSLSDLCKIPIRADSFEAATQAEQKKWNESLVCFHKREAGYNFSSYPYFLLVSFVANIFLSMSLL